MRRPATQPMHSGWAVRMPLRKEQLQPRGPPLDCSLQQPIDGCTCRLPPTTADETHRMRNFRRSRTGAVRGLFNAMDR